MTYFQYKSKYNLQLFYLTNTCNRDCGDTKYTIIVTSILQIYFNIRYINVLNYKCTVRNCTQFCIEKVYCTDKYKVCIVANRHTNSYNP